MIGQPFYKNLDKVDWCKLSINPNAISILENNVDKVDWEVLSTNPNAIPILEKNLDKVNWGKLSLNPNAVHFFCPLDYNKMEENMKPFCNELIAKTLHPKRLERICKMYNIEMEEYIEMFI
jgi:hypothetical protein